MADSRVRSQEPKVMSAWDERPTVPEPAARPCPSRAQGNPIPPPRRVGPPHLLTRALLRIAACGLGLGLAAVMAAPSAIHAQTRVSNTGGTTDAQLGERTTQSGGALPARAVRQIEELLAEKQQRTPAQRKVSSQLLDAAQPSDGVTVQETPEGVTVDIRADVTPAVLARIRALGGTIVNSIPKYRAIRALLPLTALEPLATLGAVQFIRPAAQAITNQALGPAIGQTTKDSTTEGDVAHKADEARQDYRVDGADTAISVLSDGIDSLADRKVTVRADKDNTTEGDIAHKADVARQTHSVDGTGIGIGVLSNGIDSLADRQATGDLPERVTVLPGQAGEGDEGTALLEIVHELAPGAELYFATGLHSGQAQFAANIEALCEAGADVIVDDIGYFLEAAFQDDIVAQGVNAAVADGCVHFSAAGNNGNLNNGTSRVWEGDYTAGSSLIVDGVTVGVRHVFGDGKEENALGAFYFRPVVLQWADPLGASANDYDLFLIDADGDVVASSTDTQDGTQDPIEGFSTPLTFGALSVVVVKFSGADRYLRLHAWSGQLAIATAGNTVGHSAAENAVGVAAVDVQSAAGAGGVFDGTESVETYSSDGPRRIFFQPDGAAITPGDFSSSGGELLQKPDLAAATCVSTATPGFSPFCGTSSAAPHAAAIAALMLEAAGGPTHVTLPELRTAMTGAALDIEATGVDRDSGAGIVMAPGAVDALDVAVADRNGAPIVSGTLSDRTMTLDDAALTIDVASAFSDPDNDTLTYAALLSNPDQVEVALTGSMLTLTPEGPGLVVVAVRATDSGGLSATVSFSVSIAVGIGTTTSMTMTSSKSPAWLSSTPCATT